MFLGIMIGIETEPLDENALLSRGGVLLLYKWAALSL